MEFYIHTYHHLMNSRFTFMFTERPTTDELEEFLSEIATMKKVGHHPNIVSLLGCCTIKQPLIMIMEYVGSGDLVIVEFI
jgi:serine/threonine protein kinase